MILKSVNELARASPNVLSLNGRKARREGDMLVQSIAALKPMVIDYSDVRLADALNAGPALRRKLGDRRVGKLLLPEDELKASTSAWNGIRAAFGHSNTDLGFMRNMSFKNGKLVGEVVVSINKVKEKLKSLAADFLLKFENGSMGVSLGYQNTPEWVEGSSPFGVYNGVQRNLQPDHVALLIQDFGRCNISAGCGIGLENAKHEFGVLMFELPEHVRSKVLELQSLFDDSDVIERELNPHITVAYGFTSDEGAELEKMLRVKPVTAFVDGSLGMFDNPEFDVLYLAVNTDAFGESGLLELNKKVSPLIPNARTNYVPHITLAYLNKGAGSKYLGFAVESIFLRLDRLVFSSPDKETRIFTLKSENSANARFLARKKRLVLRGRT